MSLKDKFSDFLNEIEQMEKDNEKLNKDINELEKEKAEEWKKFNTDTHMLVQIKELKEAEIKFHGEYKEGGKHSEDKKWV